MNRRRFLKWAAGGLVGSGVAGGAYAVLEARWCRVARVTVPVPRLPAPFAGMTIALVTDVHHGPFVPLRYVRDVVAMTNALRPDVVALGGDYVYKSRRFIAPCLAALGGLKAGVGCFAVLGNHDHWEGAEETRQGLADSKIAELTNGGVWLHRGGARLRMCGVGDLWEDVQDLHTALGSTSPDEAAILLSHNPDYVEQIRDERVALVLSGHTHGGQVVLPGIRPRWAPTRYGAKYLHGLVQGPVSRVYVSRGTGTVGPPVRFLCRPEVVHITLVPDQASA
jgi:predicted MPP superfamily phosphohydrolase